MLAAPTDPEEILKAVTRAYDLSCRERSPNSSDHFQVIEKLARTTLVVVTKWNNFIHPYPDHLVQLYRSGRLTRKQAFFRSLGASSMYRALIALEAFSMIRSGLSHAEYERLTGCMEKYALASMGDSLGRTWHRIRVYEIQETRNIRRNLKLPALSDREKFDKAWIAEVEHLTRVLLQDTDHLPSGVNANGLSYSYAVQLLRLADQRRAEKRDAGPKAAFVGALRTLEPISDKSIHLLLALHAASWARTATSSV
jgi:hypothetical protein